MITQPDLFETPRPSLIVGKVEQLTVSQTRIRGGMHFGSLATSKRLQDTLAVLSDGEWHTTREIRLITNSEAVHSDCAGLRFNGITVECEPCGDKKYRYRMVKYP